MDFKDEYINKSEAILAVTQDGCTANVVGVLYHLPPADVAPKNEVAKEVLLELKKQIHDHAVYTNSQDIPNYVNLKVFDAVLNNVIQKYAEGD